MQKSHLNILEMHLVCCSVLCNFHGSQNQIPESFKIQEQQAWYQVYFGCAEN
jgi:hypothetical protein